MGIKERAIIFFDIDGTLCEYEGVPTGKVQEAFKKLHNNGHAAFLCTGRGDPDIPEEIYDLGFDGVISCMGAEIRIHGENVRHVTISGEELVESVQVLLEHKMGALLLGAKEVLRTGYMKPVERETGRQRICFGMENVSRLQALIRNIQTGLSMTHAGAYWKNIRRSLSMMHTTPRHRSGGSIRRMPSVRC